MKSSSKGVLCQPGRQEELDVLCQGEMDAF